VGLDELHADETGLLIEIADDLFITAVPGMECYAIGRDALIAFHGSGNGIVEKNSHAEQEQDRHNHGCHGITPKLPSIAFSRLWSRKRRIRGGFLVSQPDYLIPDCK